MKLTDFALQLGLQVKASISEALSPLTSRIEALEKRAPEKGDQGPAGEVGIAGKDGAPGERGEKGEPGPQGEKGDPGKDGEPGPQGIAGERGEKGENGIDGKDGAPGERGEKGENGINGRDALQLDILPAIDEGKSYPRGTFARHANGLWRSAGDTQGMRNWECIVAGIATLMPEQRDERTMVIKMGLSGGEVIEHPVTFMHPLDRGVFKEGAEYLRGDGVTWGGSWFIAQKDAPEGKPGDSDSWRLAVKRGRDGKDMK